MRIFDETKTTELEHYNPEEGYLKPDKLVTHHEAIPEKVIKSTEERADELSAEGKEIKIIDGESYLVLKTYPNGGKDVEKLEPIIATSAKDAWDEEEQIAIFVPFTEAQKAELEIQTLKQKLSESDYKAIQFAEGYLTEEEYAPIKAERKSWREKINELEQVKSEPCIG